MLRLQVSLVTLLVLVSCTLGRPLYEPEPEVATEPVAGGKGFVSSQAQLQTPPMSLTASDGSGLQLLSLHAKATVDDPLATTELELSFRNPKAEVIEGKFELALPPGASITAFAMMVGSQWQEAAIVERQKGRAVYETFLHQQRDPALLEHESGNRFGVRVFPIPASGEAHLRVTYVQTFEEPTLPYRLALRGLPAIDEIDARVGVRQADSRELVWSEHHLERQRPREDIVVARNAPRTRAWRHGNHVIARVVVPSDAGEQSVPRSLAILFDTSASRAIDFGGKVDQLRDVVAQLSRHVDPGAKLVVLPFDQVVGAPVYTGPISGFADSDAHSRILRRHALGASNFEHALRVAAKQAVERVVLITDGMITAGDRDPGELRDELRQLADAGTQRLDVVAGRDRRDDDVLRTLVTGDLPHSGVVIDAGRAPEDIAMRLVRATAPPTKVKIAGAKRTWPKVLRGVQAGDAVLVYAEARPGNALEVTLDAEGVEPQEHRIAVESAKDPAFTQAWVRADVAEQLATLGDRDNDLVRAGLAALSVEHGVLNELTAFIVLETDEDYAQFGIEREGKRESDDDKQIAPEPPAPPPAVEYEEEAPTAARLHTYEFDGGAVDGELAPEPYAVRRERRGRTRLNAVSSGEGIRADAPPRGSRRARVRETPLAHAELRSIRTWGGLAERDAKPIARRSLASVERCWFSAGSTYFSGTMTVELRIDADGKVSRIDLLRDRLDADRGLRRCMDQVLRAQRFPQSSSERRRARYTFRFHPGWTLGRPGEPEDEVVEQLTDPDRYRTDEGSYEGPFAEVKRLLRLGELEKARNVAWAWRRSSPDDLLALVAIGEVAQAQGREELAARAFGSIAELYPSSAPMLRFAAGRLEALGARGLPLAVDVLEEAQRQRPDHPSSHRGLAWALVERGRYADAFDALERGFDNVYPDGRFASAVAELGQELTIVGAAWVRAEPKKRKEVERRLADLGLWLASEPSLRFVLSWETDTNDVDLHVQDGQGSRAWYGHPSLDSGGILLADVTTGFGPESFVIDGVPDAYPYYVAVHYYANGPMGYGMGHVQAIHHDGRGGLDIETIPFVAMKQDAKLLVGAVHSN